MAAQRSGGPCEAPTGYTSRSNPRPRSEAGTEKVCEPEPMGLTNTLPSVVRCRLGLPLQSRWTWTWCAPLAMPLTETVTVPWPGTIEMPGTAGRAVAGAGAGASVGDAVGVGAVAGSAVDWTAAP